MTAATMHEPQGRHQTRIAAASGWIGSALEYYDFFIYATAASLVFPQIFFPSSQPDGRHRRVARDLRGRLCREADRRLRARPSGATRTAARTCCSSASSSWASRPWRSGCCRPTRRSGVWAPVLLVVLRLIQGFAVAGEISGASSMILEHAPFGRRGYFASFTLQGVQAGQILAAAVFLPLSYALSNEAFSRWGWRVPFLLSVVVLIAGYIIRREVDETPAFAEERAQGDVPRAPVIDALDQPLAGHAAGHLHGADERHSGRGDDFRRRLRRAAGLRRRHGQDHLSLDPGHRQHRRRHRHPVRRRSLRPDRPAHADHRRLACSPAC